jgi:hypothetical protein
MGKKTVIEQKIRRHTKELEESIKIIKPKLLEAFVRVYGEKHRQHITYIIENLDYIFFISEEFSKIIKENKGIRKSVKKTIENYLKYLNTVSYKFSSVSLEDEQKYIIDKFLPRFPFPYEDYEYYEEAIGGDVPCCMAQVKKECYTLEPDFIILLPIYIIDIKIIIHEINHALGANPLCIVDDRYLLVDFLFKEEIPEELENDFIAELILREYLKIGGSIPRPLRRMPIGNAYKEKDYILKYFFETLEPLILESRISRNYNLFYKIVGDENINYLSSLMIDLYNQFEIDKYIELIKLINEIGEYLESLEVEDAEEFLASLENKGIKLNRIKKKEEL